MEYRNRVLALPLAEHIAAFAVVCGKALLRWLVAEEEAERKQRIRAGYGGMGRERNKKGLWINNNIKRSSVRVRGVTETEMFSEPPRRS